MEVSPMSIDQKAKTISISGKMPVALNEQTKCGAVYSPGSCLAQKSNKILICNFENPQKITPYSCPLLSMDRIAFSRNGQYLAAGTFTTEHWMNGFLLTLNDGKVHRFYEGNVNSLSPVKPSGSKCVAFDPSDRILAVAGALGASVKLLDVQSIISGKPKLLMNINPELNLFTCEALTWSHDGHFLGQQGTYTNPGFVQKWLKRCILIWEININDGIVNAKHSTTLEYSGGGLITKNNPIGLAFNSSGTMLAVGGDANNADTIKLFDPNEPRLLFTSDHLGSSICWLNFIPDTEFLASGTMDGVFRLWCTNLKDGNTTLTLCTEVRCGGQIIDAIPWDSGKALLVAHNMGSGQIGFSSILLP
jgi:WD40 repeat protein